MSVTNLRRSGSLDSEWLESIEEDGYNGVEIDDVNRDFAPIIDAHPYPNQVIITGNINYREESDYTQGRDISVEFELRTGSRLLIFEYESDIPSLSPVTEQFLEITDNSPKIYHNLHAPEDSLWDFLLASDRVVDITVLDGGREASYREVEDIPTQDVIGEYSIESASVGFQYEEESILVTYQNGNLQIESDHERAREYIVELFEREVLGPN
ncbi:hypothetical protein [Halorubrum sp. Ib24]|uniref:hypothetical protein n=1 Tax=Halorubrum sp. Ib24 TaxID=1383850 RepID=UPI00117B2206|nr:hypothetical protein [Halorubrum sp. Ib24]